MNNIKHFCENICFVSNSNIKNNYYEKIKYICDNVLIRENYGLDAWAYKYAIEYYGYEELKKYDEVICCNFTFFGPFYPFEELFNTMDQRSCDWWGMHKWWTPSKINYNHIPSFFIAYRKSLIKSEHFKNYWTTLRSIKTYNDSVEFHEQRQTPYYDSKGFISSVYLDNGNYIKYEPFLWPLKLAHRPIIEQRYPFIKRRCFYVKKNEMYFFDSVKQVIPYLKKNSLYNINFIYDNIVRTQTIKDKHIIYRIKYKFLSIVHPIKKQRERYKIKYKASIFEREFKELFTS